MGLPLWTGSQPGTQEAWVPPPVLRPKDPAFSGPRFPRLQGGGWEPSGVSLQTCPGLHPEITKPLGTGLQGSPPSQATTLGPSEPLSLPCNPRRDSEEGTDAHPHPQGLGPSPAGYLTLPPGGPPDGASAAGDQVGQCEHRGPAPSPSAAPGGGAQAGARCTGRPSHGGALVLECSGHHVPRR